MYVLLPNALWPSWIGLVLLLGAMSESLALLKLGSVLMSMTRVTTNGHTGPWGVGYLLRPCWCP